MGVEARGFDCDAGKQKPLHGETGVRVANVEGSSLTRVPPVEDSSSSVAKPALLKAHVSAQRLVPYMDATFNDETKALSLYAWGRKLSAAIFHDISLLEVALRNALDRVLVDTYGENWFRLGAVLFDSRTYTQLSNAWEGLPAKFLAVQKGDGKIRGRLIASCMFGTWTSMLDAGGSTGIEGPCARVDHNDLWTRERLLAAFPGAAQITGADRIQLDRDWVHAQVREVNILRNRVAHHESLVNGYPVPGTGELDKPPERRTAWQGADACIRLAKMIDRELAAFLAHTSEVNELLTEDPRREWGFLNEEPTSL